MAWNFPLWATLCMLARVAGLFLLLAAGADAHAVLIASSPANNDILAAAPEKILLRFNEAVRVVRFSVAAGDGVAREISASSTGAEVEAPLPRPLAEGTVIFSYRVVSEDGHPVGGSVVFHVGKPSAPASMIPAAARGRTAPASAPFVVDINEIRTLRPSAGGRSP